MGVASLVLGIISLIIGFIPFCGMIAFVPAIIGLILGIVEIVKKSKEKAPKGMGIAGTILSAISIVVMVFWFFVVGIAFSTTDYTDIEDLQRQIENQVENNYYDTF